MSSKKLNLYSCFEESISANNKPLLILDDGSEYNYKILNTLSSQMASFLFKIGIKPGDRVSIQVAKSPEALCLYLACLRAGLVYHPLNPDYKENELEFFINNAAPSVIITDQKNLDVFDRLASKNDIQHIFTMNENGQGTFVEKSKLENQRFETFKTPSDHIAALLYSSGTTGTPKGIMLTHENLISNTRTLVKSWQFTDDDVLLHALPIFHVHGLFVAIGCALYSGASMYWLPKFNEEKILKNLPKCSALMGVPTYYTRLLATKKINKEICRNMRVFISGSAPLLIETFHDFERISGHQILERYGMTETNMNTSNPIQGERKPGTVGPPLPGVEVKIVDEMDNELQENDIGNLLVRGPNVFKGYWKMADKTAEDFTEDQFFRTGDKAKLDNDGYITIVGRSKDMIISGGLNVYPKEIESVIDDIDGVVESAVIGVPHKDFGEAVIAIVVTEFSSDINEAEIISASKKQLAGYKTPKKIIFVKELLRNTMSKVQKNILRKNYQDLFT